MIHRQRRVVLALMVLTSLVAAACGNDSGQTTEPDPSDHESSSTTEPDPSGQSSSSTTEAPDPFADPRSGNPDFAETGPHVVGVTTLMLADGTPVEVYYPGDPGRVAEAEPASYATDDALPADLRAIVPADLDLNVPIDGYRDLAPSTEGPFPLLLFSHGASAYRNYYSALLSGISSHGIVVASTDYLDRGLAAFALGAFGGDTEEQTEEELEAAREERRAAERATMLSTLDLLVAESADPTTLLAGSVDPGKIAAGGHSAGVGTTAAASDDPRIRAAVGWAGASGDFDPGTATMLLFAERDTAATPERGAETYAELAAPKALGVIGEAGHNSFTDFCRNQQEGVDLIAVALDLGFPIPESLVELGYNGCRPEDVPPTDVWPIIQHFTVAWILHQTDVNDEPRGLGDNVAGAFAVAVDYEHEP